MNVIFSRKGVDSAAGGCASPIVDGMPISLPIPTAKVGATTTYRALGLGELFEEVTRGKRSGDENCHEDPMFGEGICGFGQTGRAQSHLTKHGVGVGDVFLFFGLFSDQADRRRHHRIFGYLVVDRVIRLGAKPTIRDSPPELPRTHPHCLGDWNANNTLYFGRGRKSKRADRSLRLSADDAPISIWNVPRWLKLAGLSYHASAERWLENDRLKTVSRGQEFIAKISREGQLWLKQVMEDVDR